MVTHGYTIAYHKLLAIIPLLPMVILMVTCGSTYGSTYTHGYLWIYTLWLLYGSTSAYTIKIVTIVAH